MDTNANRFVAVNLTDAEWRALRAVTPDPCAWIKTQIHRLLDESGVAPVAPASDDQPPAEEWGVLTSQGL
jgi:hypothetical protein